MSTTERKFSIRFLISTSGNNEEVLKTLSKSQINFEVEDLSEDYIPWAITLPNEKFEFSVGTKTGNVYRLCNR